MKVRVVKSFDIFKRCYFFIPQYFDCLSGWRDILRYPVPVTVDDLDDAVSICKEYKKKNSFEENEVVWEEN